MSWIIHDPDEWEMVVKTETHPGLFDVPFGTISMSQRRRTPEEVSRIKAEKDLVIRLRALAELRRQNDVLPWKILVEAADEIERAKDVIRDLLTSYLASFDDNKDELAHRAECILKE